jgi:tRNA (guanine37-N1)-methyltransferase
MGRSIPDVLMSGHHGNVEKWRREMSEKITQERRPDMWKRISDA